MNNLCIGHIIEQCGRCYNCVKDEENTRCPNYFGISLQHYYVEPVMPEEHFLEERNNGEESK